MADTQLVERMRQELLSQGVDWDTNKIQNYITLRKSAARLSNAMNNQVSERQQNQPMTDMFSSYRPSTELKIPQEDKNALWDFTGNLLWEAMDSATFGAAGWAETDLEEALTGGGPEGFAGRVGAGLGSFAGFLIPMAGTGKAIGAGVSAMKGGTKYAAKKLTEEGYKYLGETAVKGQGYKAFNKLSNVEKADIFKPFTDDILEFGSKLSNKQVREAYTGRFGANLQREIAERLQNVGIRPTSANVKAIEDVIKNASGVSKNSTLPVASLEEKIKLILGNTFGASTTAAVAATALAEGITFAAVETPFELFNSMEEGRKADYTGRAAHAFALGNALGLIKYVPGGKDWKAGGIAKEAIKGWRIINKKKPIASLDLSDASARKQLQTFAESVYNRTGGQIFRDKMGDLGIYHKGDIATIMNKKGGAKKIQEIMMSIERDFSKRWLPTFIKEASEDIVGATPRMLAGSMAFNYEMVFAEDIPLEDKVFHALLGAYMTKKGRKLEYTGQGGSVESYTISDKNRPSDNFNTIGNYLEVLGMHPKDYNLSAAIASERILQKFPANIRETDDIKSLEKILEPVIVQDNGTNPPKPKKNAGQEGTNPIYEYLMVIYDRQIGQRKGTRMLGPDRVTREQIKAIESKLKKHDFLSITETGGINKLSHIDDIMYNAADGTMKKVIDLHVDAMIDMYNHLAGAGINITRSADTNVPTMLWQISGRGKQGEKLTAENKELLATYMRMLNAFDGRQVVINKDKGQRKRVTNEDFKGLKEIVDKFETKIDEIIYGDSKLSMTRAHKLMQEGSLYELIVGQQFYKGIRETHQKLNDTNNSKKSWNIQPENEGSGKHDGIIFDDLITQLLYHPDGSLYKSIEFGKGVSESQKRMINTLHRLLSSDPNGDSILFEGQSHSITITGNDKLALNNLREVLYRNQMKNLLYESAIDSSQFIHSYQDYAFRTFLNSAVKRNGKPLNANDRAAVSQLLDFRLLGPNFQLIDVIGVIENLQSVALNPGKLTVEAGRLLDGGKPFHFESKSFAELDLPKGLKSSMEALQERGIKTADQIELMIKTYKDIIEPLMTDGKGNGFIKPSTTITQITEAQLENIIFKLDAIYKMKDTRFHDNLLQQLSNLKDGVDGIDDVSRESLNYLYHLYGSGRASTSQLIRGMAERKLYSFKDQEIIIDPGDKFLKEKIKEVITDVEFDVATRSDAALLEGKINKFKTFESRDSEVNVYQNVTKQSLIADYNLPESVKFERKDLSDVINEAHKINGDGEKVYFKERPNELSMTYEQQFKFLSELQKAVVSAGETRVLRRLSGTEGYGIWTESDYTVFDNHLFKELDNIVGKDGWAIVDMDFANRRNGVDNARINENGSKLKLYNLIYNTRKHIDTKLRTDDYGTLMHEKHQGGVVVEIPGVKWAISINKNKLDKVVNIVRHKLDEYKKTYTDPKFKGIFRELEKHFQVITEKQKKGPKGKEKEEIVYRPSDVLTEGSSLETLLTVIQNDAWMKKYWWDHLAEVHNNKNDQTGVKLARRIKMYANTSMRMLSDTQLSETLKLFQENISNKKELRQNSAYKGLKKLKKNGGMRIIIARDENFELGGRQFSVLKELDAQIKGEKAKNPLLDFVEIKEGPEGQLEFAGGKDLSKVDSYMVIDKTTLDGLMGLNGAGYVSGAGGIKPMIHKIGDGVILGKTAFITDPNMTKFFKKNNLDGVLFESGAKIVNENSKIYTEFDSMESLAKKTKISKDHVELLKLEDMSLGFVVKPNHNATLPYQVTNHLNLAESRDLFDNYLKSELNEFVKDSQRYFSISDPLEGLAMAKMMSEGASGTSPNSLYARWINSNGFIHSQVIMPDFIRHIKSNRIDKGGIMSMQTPHGGQAVNSPGEKLRFTTFTKGEGQTGEIFTYGEALLPHVSGDKPIDLQNLHIIKHKSKGKDELVHISKIKGADKLISDRMLLKDALKAIKSINKNYQIAVTYRRNPSTRPGDMVIVGIKDLLHADYGNQTKLNASDFALRLEGDYDVDKTDFFWDAPTSVLNKWKALSGEVLRANPDTYESGNKTSLRKKSSGGLVEKFDWVNPTSVKEWDTHLANSEKLRGTIVKTQRLLSALEHYDSSPNLIQTTEGKGIGGFALNLKNVENGGYIYVDPIKLRKARRLLAEDIQNITDSLTGYNDRVYNQNWYQDFLFGGISGRYEGIFSRAAYDKTVKKGKWVPNPDSEWSATNVERAIITEAIKPYNAMLRLGTSLFSNGKQENVRYEDFLTNMAQYDASMNNLSNRVYWKLKNQGSAKTKVDLADLNKYFLNKNQKVENIFGDFGQNIRPGLFQRGIPTKVGDQFPNMLAFERTMSVLVHNDYMKLELPGKLEGEALNNYHDFYSKHMYSENYDAVGKEFIKQLQKNDKMFGYANYLAFNISKQQGARRNALAKGQKNLAEVIQESIERLEAQKNTVETSLIFGEGAPGAGMEYAKKIRDGVISSYINDVYKHNRLPKDWNEKARPAKGDLRPDQLSKSFPEGKAGEHEITSFVKNNYSLFRNYARNKGVIKFKGVSTPEQIELLIWNNMLSKYAQIGIHDMYSGRDKALEMDKDIADFQKFYRNEWRQNLSGSDWTADQTRTSSIVNDRLELLFQKWNIPGKGTEEGGHGMLMLWKLMKPAEDPNAFTYLHRRITPAFKSESLSMLKLGLRFISNAPDNYITKIVKDGIFDHTARWYNNSFRAMYGQQGERGNALLNRLSNEMNHQSDVFAGAPLVDNIKGWKPGFQEIELNDNLALLFGNDRRSITSVFANSIVDPSVVGNMSSLSKWAFSPVAYIPESTSLMNYPSINGFKNFKQANMTDANIMLGNSHNLNLLFNRTPKVIDQPYSNMHEKSSRGYESLEQRINEKVGCK